MSNPARDTCVYWIVVPFFFVCIPCETAIISSLLPSASPGPSSIDFFDSVTANMGRTVDQEVHAAFVEFRAKEDDKVRLPCVLL